MKSKYGFGVFFGSHKTLVSRKGFKKYYRMNQAYTNLYLNPQAIPLFQNIIFDFLHKIAKCCHNHLVFKFNPKINQYHILKSFIQFKFLDSCIWIFKYRKYFSRIYIHTKHSKTIVNKKWKSEWKKHRISLIFCFHLKKKKKTAQFFFYTFFWRTNQFFSKV